MKKNMTILILFLVIVFSMLGGSILVRNNYLIKDKKVEEKLTENVKGVTNLSNIPIVKNIAPTLAYLGEEYRFDLGIMDADTYYSNITVTIDQGPSWLKVEGLSLVGVPPFYAEESNKVVVKITDGENYTLYTYYLLVQKRDESI